MAVLASGGLDSAVLLGEMARRHHVYPVYVRQGLAWEKVELYWLRRYLARVKPLAIEPLKILALPMSDVYESHWSVSRRKVPGARTPDRAVYLPGRNLVLMVKTAVFCALNKIPRVALGSLGHNPFPDASPGFFRQWALTLRRGLNVPLTIEAPYRRMSKVEVIRRGREFPLELSFSCINPRGLKHCGRCNKCAERRKAFRMAGVPDRTLYANG